MVKTVRYLETEIKETSMYIKPEIQMPEIWQVTISFILLAVNLRTVALKKNLGNEIPFTKAFLTRLPENLI